MKKYFLFALLALYFLPGCAPSKPTDDIEILPSERLINKLEANRRRIKTFEGNGTVTIKSPQFNNPAAFKVVLTKPDSLQLIILGPFGIELAQALVTKDNFIFYDALQNTAYTGEVDNEVLKTIFKVDLAFSDLMDAFVGSVNLTENLYKPPTSYEVIYDKYILSYVDSTDFSSSLYEIDVKNLGIMLFKTFDDNSVQQLEGRYSKFEFFENVAVPYKVDITNKKQNQTITIDYRNISVNKKNIFIDFQIPSDAEVIKW